MYISVGEKNSFDKLGRGGGQSVFLQGTDSVNVLGAFYRYLPLGLKDTIFG